MRLKAHHLVLAALAGLAALVIHELAYLAAYPVAAARAEALADHGHLSAQWMLATPLAVVAAALFVLRRVRQLRLAPDLDWLPLAVMSGGLYVAQEAVEAALGPEGLWSLATNPATAVGLLLAPVVAAVFVRAVRHASELIALLLRPPAAATPSVRPVLRPGDRVWAPTRTFSGNSPRGPPRLVRSWT